MRITDVSLAADTTIRGSGCGVAWSVPALSANINDVIYPLAKAGLYLPDATSTTAETTACSALIDFIQQLAASGVGEAAGAW